MNDGRQMGMHYMDNGFPYPVNESFGADYFQGLTHVPVNYAFSGSIPDQVFVSAYNFFIFLFNFLNCVSVLKLLDVNSFLLQCCS